MQFRVVREVHLVERNQLLTYNRDLLLYPLHAGYWIAFLGARIYARTRATPSLADSPSVATAPAAATPAPGRFSRLVLLPQVVAFALMYSVVDTAVLPHRVPQWSAVQRPLGALVIVAAAVLAVWALLYFRSWRLRATLDTGHELATGGPFRLVRHPIYLSLDMLALGSAIWIPTPMMLAGVALMILGGDLRARAEERVLLVAFGDAYRRYSAHTKRFFPGVY